MRELVEFIIEHLVDFPDEVKISSITGERLTVFEIKVAKSDIGKVLGRGGKNIHSLRQIVRAASEKAGQHVMIEIIA